MGERSDTPLDQSPAASNTPRRVATPSGPCIGGGCPHSGDPTSMHNIVDILTFKETFVVNYTLTLTAKLRMVRSIVDTCTRRC